MSQAYFQGSQGEPITPRMQRGRTAEREKRGRSYSSRSRSASRTKRGKYSSTVFKDSAKDNSSPYGSDIIRFKHNTLPKCCTMPMKYVEKFELQFTTGALNYYQFRLNSLYDPNYTGTGHQPYYFDQMMQFYNVYVVYGAKVTLTASAVTPNTPMTISFQTNSISATAPTDTQLIEEQPDSKVGILNGAINNLVLTRYYKIDELFGISKDSLLSNDAYQGTNAANPSAVTYLNILAKPILSTATSYCQFSISIKFYTYFKQSVNAEES